MENRKPGQKRRIRGHADKAALYGLLIALAFIFSYVEALIPLPVPVPGIKLGLANLVNVVGLYTVGAAGTLVVGLLRIVMVGFTFSNPGSMLYALAGGILSLAAILLHNSDHLRHGLCACIVGRRFAAGTGVFGQYAAFIDVAGVVCLKHTPEGGIIGCVYIRGKAQCMLAQILDIRTLHLGQTLQIML